jgi:hypothetical protein
VQKSTAFGFAESTLTSVVPLEASLAAVQCAQDRFGDVVAPFFALSIVARHREERRRVLDLDPANVRGLRNDVARVPLLDLEAEALELGNFALEASCFVFAAAPFTGALGSFTESSMVHECLRP